MPLYLYKYLRHSERLTKYSLLTLILLKELSKMYFTKTQTLPTFKEIYADDLKEVSTNYLKFVIKNTDDKQLINNCKLEIKRRTTRRSIN